MIRVLVVSRYPAVRAGLRALLEPGADIEVVQAPHAVDFDRPDADAYDVAVVDGADAGSLVSALGRSPAGKGVVLLGGRVPPSSGAEVAPRGYLARDASSEEILAAVRSVASGLTVVDPGRLPELVGAPSGVVAVGGSGSEETLTPREQEVLQLMAAGLPNKAIGRDLGISDHTAKFHVSSVLAKLGAESRTEAVTLAARRGLLLL